MNHVYNLADLNLLKPSALTIGVFDGVHRGHSYLIEQFVEKAHESGLLAVVLTFFPHPDVVVRGIEGRYYLTTVERRAELLLNLGVDYVITHPFNEQTRHTPAQEFVQQFVNSMRVRELWIGKDFALGYEREGDVTFLREQGAQHGFDVHAIDLLNAKQQGPVISSSKIRQSLQEGDIQQANEWLGYPYTVEGEVVHGEKRGRSIGFPTANIDVWELQLIPANGVYAGWATVKGERHKAVTNIGYRPTFNGADITVESHLLDFNSDIYGCDFKLTFEHRLRGEKRFSGIDELKQQIADDCLKARELL